MTRRLLPLALMLTACGGVPFRMDAPPAFKKYDEGDDYRLISPDGVRVRGRVVENEPLADLAFWREALKAHLEKRGYVFQAEQCFKTERGLDGCTLDFVLPYGAEDWVHSETLFVRGDEILLLEAVGPYDRYAAYKPALSKAYLTFRPE